MSTHLQLNACGSTGENGANRAHSERLGQGIGLPGRLSPTGELRLPLEPLFSSLMEPSVLSVGSC